MFIVVLVTASGKKEAERIARGLIEKKLAACVNIVDKIDSLFFWQGKIDRAQEALLIIKSKKSLFSRIARLVKSLHSYDVPEIIALPVVAGEKNYVSWLDECLRKSG